ncbi:MAG: glutathione S-transferase [Oceanospirillaceae bacterium]|nr:glutathione S-transferase [Oceanospirillaceae bacterium]
MSSDILYSFRRCPFAMRARIAINYANMHVELREVVLRNKPLQLREVSPKATVPVLVLSSGEVLDESLDIMLYALSSADPDQWLANTDKQMALIAKCDDNFKAWLDKYKYADRHPEFDQAYYRAQCCIFINELEVLLSDQEFLSRSSISLADAAIFPFIRQFAHVDKQWFYQAEFMSVQRWLDRQIASDLFVAVMDKYPAWIPESVPKLFP